MGKSFLVADFYHWISGGIVVEFLPKLSKNKLDFLCLLIGFTTNGGIYKAIGKAFLKNAIVGFYMIVVGWVIAIIGYFSK